ncbi:PREDICTED: uncharacterized protein LOC104729570 [Camelina sativa]|uniref:Uncharacterized protein LOC104729570 n=1 Tax=Camelina sativa TaxID=90675 RepID=A0ABM0UV64_CAMSA|nr:PREDICTED: uncharacterized protein LOC104729570 [Camelina sativa]
MDPIYEEDVFLGKYQSSELKIASEFLTTWLPFLSRDLCKDCLHLFSHRIRSLDPEHSSKKEDREGSGSMVDDDSNGKLCDSHSGGFVFGSLSEDSVRDAMQSQSTVSETASPRMSWADMAQEDDGLEEEEEEHKESESSTHDDVDPSMKTPEKRKMSREERERYRFVNVKKLKLFSCYEKIRGESVNILEGLELHTGVFSAVEQKKIVDFVYELQDKGLKGELQERTFATPKKWMRGKGRVTIQFGCCYNYITDRQGNPPGILKRGAVDPMPSLFKVMIKRLIAWHVLPPTCVPDSCIVNIYYEDDCIPPHIDNHDFLRPFCTVSFLSECNILFGSYIKTVGPGEFSGSYSIPLPVGSVLVLNGNGADVAKHCIPAVPKKRISITFRKMDESKRPVGFTLEPDLQGIKPLPYEQNTLLSTPDTVASSSSRSSNDQNGRSQNHRAAHGERSRHRRSRDYPSESREWSSSSQRREKARPTTPNCWSYRPKVTTTSSDNV